MNGQLSYSGSITGKIQNGLMSASLYPVSTGALQSKYVMFIGNGSITIQPDSGYDGLSSVAITVNVPLPSEPYIEETYNANGNLISAVMHGHTHVREYLFNNCGDLTSISMPNEVTSIEANAFYECDNLLLTSLPSGLTSIGNNAFYDCENLALTSLPSGVTSIGRSAFASCTNLALTSIPNGVTMFDYWAFRHCTNLALTSIPSGVTHIGMRAFSECTNLPLTYLPSSVTSFEQYAFASCTSIVNLEIASSKLGDGIRIFYGCTGLQKVWLRNTCIEVTATSMTDAPFYGTNDDLVIYVEASSKPAGYGVYFEYVGINKLATVIYGQTTRPW